MFTVRRPLVALVAAVAAAFPLGPGLLARQPARTSPPAPAHAKAVKRLLIRDAMVIYGNGKPDFGPTDIVVQDGLIARVGPSSPKDPPADAVIDATGKYVMPGIVNTHVHLQDERGGAPQPFQYEIDLYLASAAHTIAAPRILIYTPNWRGRTNGAPETPAASGGSPAAPGRPRSCPPGGGHRHRASRAGGSRER